MEQAYLSFYGKGGMWATKEVKDGRYKPPLNTMKSLSVVKVFLEKTAS